MRHRKIAIVLALFTGFLGVHRFYLGQKKFGWLYLGFCWTLVPFFIALVDVIAFSSMTYAAFNRKYNLGHDFKKVFPDDETLLEASTDPEREKELLAQLESLQSPEKVMHFLENAKTRGEYLPRAVYAKASMMLHGKSIIYRNRLDLHV
jgi:TM2 domain-containing membrane protein YozV